LNPVKLRCGHDWHRRYRCGLPSCSRCLRRQMRREFRAVLQRLDALQCQFLPITIKLGAMENVQNAIKKFRADLRNRLNICRQASKRWADAAIWGWFAVLENGSSQSEVSAHAIVRIGRLLGQADVQEAITATWGKPGQVEVGAAVGHDGLLVLARRSLGSAFTHDGPFPSFPDFRALRFRYGRVRAPRCTACVNPILCEPMPVLF
jgi:hypothetical protein